MNPLKQGLKPDNIPTCLTILGPVKEVNPLKQGLKPGDKTFIQSVGNIVKEVNPLKQGLKPRYPYRKVRMDHLLVKEVNPLKQGLKLCSICWERRTQIKELKK